MKLLYIDLFCGAGGTSTGVESAMIAGEKCAKVIACVNHDKNAIASHSANHPDALHYTEDIRTLKLGPLVDYSSRMKKIHPESYLVLWASLECTNFSKAKGGQSRDADSRTLANHLFRYIEALNPDYVQIENVEEFMSWGDVDENGKPISKDKGRSYLNWITKVKKYGYDYDYRILNSADFGAYTSRKRFFGQFVKKDLPLTWPEPTHSKIGGSTGLFGYQRKWKAVKEVLNLNDEGVSIFIRKKALSDKTLERIYAGLIKYVAGGKKQFIAKYYSGSPQSKVVDIDNPSGAVTTKDHHSLISAKFISAYYGNGDNVSDIDCPSPTVTTKDRLSLVTSKFLTSQYSNGFNTDLESPNPTLVATPKQSIVSAKWLMDTSFNNIGSSLEEPSKVITANRKWHYLMNPQFQSKGRSLNEPCFTLIAKMDKMPPYLVIAENGEVSIEVFETDSEITGKIKEFMALYGIVDIKMRMLHIKELLQIMGFSKDYKLIGTQAEQKKYIGNAVEVNVAKALCEATALKIHEMSKTA